MASPSLLFLLLATTIPYTLSSSPPVDSFIFAGCTQEKYSPDSPYSSNLQALLTSLLSSATYSSYSNFTVLGSSVVYGLYQCRGDLSMPDCSSCVSRSLTRVSALCPSTCGAAVQLEGCFVKYDNATFVGVEDKTVVFKKCGPSVGSSDNMGSTEAVLSGLSGSGGYFRVVGSGKVKGVGQCTGDLGFDQCQDCLSEAIRRLRSDCGTANYGDLFLGKCYARYSVGGAHAYEPKAHGKSKNGGEKTFVIIIGLLAGIAVLVIFFAFLKTTCAGRHGK
ncbi:plasmodesmata-located protein 7-like [Prosopis cineraria]|uniref:plasmodesmata-located protein 7-like n=1 Tax=Prosopis cineraria TaxID=364024 RepID=UPI00240FB59B|nr:plasmodesmata-located protein 7-like [Prosopis cineraria]